MSKMCTPQFYLAFQLVFSFSGEDFFHVNGLWEILFFNWKDLKSVFIGSWGCSDVLFEGVTQYTFWSVIVFKVCIFTDISTRNKSAATCVETSANPAIHVQQWPDSTFPLFSTKTHGQRGELFNRYEWST